MYSGDASRRNPDAIDRLIATVETLEGLYARAKDDGDPAALAELLAQLQSARD